MCITASPLHEIGNLTISISQKRNRGLKRLCDLSRVTWLVQWWGPVESGHGSCHHCIALSLPPLLFLVNREFCEISVTYKQTILKHGNP